MLSTVYELEVSTVVENYIRYGNGKWRYFLTVNCSLTVVNGNGLFSGIRKCVND